MNCSFRAKRRPPYDVAAGTTETITCTLRLGEPGHFEGQIHVYLADEGLREIILKVHGQAMAADSYTASTKLE